MLLLTSSALIEPLSRICSLTGTGPLCLLFLFFHPALLLNPYQEYVPWLKLALCVFSSCFLHPALIEPLPRIYYVTETGPLCLQLLLLTSSVLIELWPRICSMTEIGPLCLQFCFLHPALLLNPYQEYVPWLKLSLCVFSFASYIQRSYWTLKRICSATETGALCLQFLILTSSALIEP